MNGLLLRWGAPLIGAAVALVLIFMLYGSLDFGKFLDGLRSANLIWVVILAVTILLEQFFNGWKWRQVLHDVKPVDTFRLTGALLAGYGANVLVPLGISPLVRAWIIARLEQLKMATVLTTTIISRFIDGVVFALFAGVLALVGQVPQVEGNLELGLSVAGALNIVLFGGLLWAMFRFRTLFASDGPVICRLFDWVAARMRANGPGLRTAICDGVIWPRNAMRRVAVFVGAIAAKLIAATHFVWAGLAVGVVLAPWDYIFLMVFSGFIMVLGRFVRIPGSFIFGAGFALQMLGVPPETALLMILFNYIMTILLVVGIGLIVLWQSGIDIRRAHLEAETLNAGL
ncbi:lysylphosphatidylglycerol synthase transmembrane domain-containing protein [Sulfitobacter sp. F26204]|uniref:lysylphosphatidylglycerol synthase transmembrane domain-containing protein n=1 Tax=Sulfitobacter sp. F26204 TaxID=2996014 RepID=UPI00225DD52D|nr:lysylphosphatidylglycerol synthase transmembrane domain-containing protein [Sulfitobacter sp. F26204]MCX7561477.1 lysylphosphatidylglycerol synthase transmembrane domain-containing protein [Sulfitobacter sp. F26204]